jgi:hypothetical protein
MAAFQPSPPNRRDAIFLAALGLGGLSAVGVLTSLVVRQEQISKDRFQQLLREEPLTGKIAYVMKNPNQIRIIDANQLPTSTEPSKIFQVPGAVTAIAWANRREIVFACQAYKANPLGTPDDGRKFEFNIVSDGVFKLNCDNGQVTMIFDPYGEDAKKIFGDVKKGDADTERRLEKEFNETKGTRAHYGNSSTLQVQEIKIDPTELKIFVRIKDSWCIVGGEKRSTSLAGQIPVNFEDQSTSRSKVYRLDDSRWRAAKVIGGKTAAIGEISLEAHAGQPVWLDN